MIGKFHLFAGRDLLLLKHEVIQSRKAALAESTHKAHITQWKTFYKFCSHYGLVWIPASAEILSLYAQFLARSFKSPQSVANYVAGVKLLHIVLHQNTSAFDTVEYRLTIKGITRQLKHRPRQAAPITPALLAQFRQHLDIDQPTDATFWSLFLIAFYAMARKSNLVPVSRAKFDPEKQLCRDRVLVGQSCLLVFWSWAKNIQVPDRLHKIPLLAILGSALFPVAAYVNMCRLVKVGPKNAAFSIPHCKQFVV